MNVQKATSIPLNSMDATGYQRMKFGIGIFIISPSLNVAMPYWSAVLIAQTVMSPLRHFFDEILYFFSKRIGLIHDEKIFHLISTQDRAATDKGRFSQKKQN